MNEKKNTIFSKQIHLLDSCYQEELSQTITIDQAIKLIGGVNPAHNKKVSEIRAKKHPSNADYKKEKCKLPHAILHGRFKGYREENCLSAFSGILFLDFDNLEANQVEPIKKLLADLPYIICCYTSVSSTGVHAWAQIEGIEAREQYKAVYRQLTVFFYNHFGLKLCQGSNSITQLVALSYDADILINQNPIRMYLTRQLKMISSKHLDRRKMKSKALI